MACIVDLNSMLDNTQDVGGAWIYLGYSSSITTMTADGDDETCFGITDPLSGVDGNDPYTDSPGVDIAMSTHTLVDYTSPFDVDFNGVDPGFYGFLYIVGDQNPEGDEDGIINGAECGEWNCIEVEVLASPADMVGGDLGIICEENLPGAFSDFDLTAEITGYIEGGTWSVTPNDPNIDISDPEHASVASGTAPNEYIFTYVLNPEDLTSKHMISPCDDCGNDGVEVTFEVTEALEAGTGSSIAVCN